MRKKCQVYNYDINDHYSCKRIIFSTVSQNMTQCNDFRIYRLLRSHFLKKKTWKNAYFSYLFIDPYRTRPGTEETCSLHVTPPVKIIPKTSAKIASLNSSICVWRLETRRVHRRERKAPRAILELSDAIFAPGAGSTTVPGIKLPHCYGFNPLSCPAPESTLPRGARARPELNLRCVLVAFLHQQWWWPSHSRRVVRSLPGAGAT